MKALLPKGEYSKEFLRFFDWTIKYLEEHGKELEIKNTAYVLNDGKCGGYCDGNKIVVAGKSSRFCQVLAHELSHLFDYINEFPLLNNYFYWDRFEIDSFESLYNLILIERHCELGVLKLNRKWNLFDPIIYAKSANAYLHLHHFIFLKKMYISMPDLHSKEILDLMPDKIVSAKSLKKIDMDVMLVFDSLLKKSRGKSRA